MIERHIEKTVLSNGVVVITEPMPHLQVVSLGIWIRAGSRHETLALNGITHFIEHAVFKGTQHRTAQKIALEADILGGNFDAFTTREFTGFYIKSLVHHMPQAFDLLADLITKPLFDRAEMEKERDVILEEIKMVEDTPDELLSEMFVGSFWPNHPLGLPIAGTSDSVKTLNQEILYRYYQEIYSPKNIVIVAAGNVKHEQILELAERYFGELSSDFGVPAEETPTTNATILSRKKRGLEQTHIVLGVPCPTILSPRRYACSLLSTILGGGLSSRLFQTVREQHGLAYSVFSSVDAFRDTGCLSIYLAVSNRRVRKALDLVIDELQKIKTHPVTADELQANKDQIKTSILLGLDSVTARMDNLAQNEILFGKELTIEEIIAGIDEVTIEDIQTLAAELFIGNQINMAILGISDWQKLGQVVANC